MKIFPNTLFATNFLMVLRDSGKWWFMKVLVALSTGLLFSIHQNDLHNQTIGVLTQENQQLIDQQKELLQSHQQLKYINGLAMEFSMDPAIVTLVDHYAREHMQDGGPEWRLLRTPEFMTHIMLSLIYAESKGNTHAIGDNGKARGLTQIWVSTAKEYGEVTPDQLHRPETNIAFSFKHFHGLLKRYRGNLALTLYAWNRGPNKVDSLIDYGKSPENGYAKKIYEAAFVNNRGMLSQGLPVSFMGNESVGMN